MFTLVGTGDVLLHERLWRRVDHHVFADRGHRWRLRAELLALETRATQGLSRCSTDQPM